MQNPPQQPSTPVKLLDRVRAAVRTRHYSIRTEQAYLGWIKRFILFHDKRHPQTMGGAEISAFLTHLAVDLQVAASTQNQALNALMFLYREVLGIEVGGLPGLQQAKKPERLPVVLSPEEVKRVLAGLPEDKWLLASLLYGAGLRLTGHNRGHILKIGVTKN